MHRIGAKWGALAGVVVVLAGSTVAVAVARNGSDHHTTRAAGRANAAKFLTLTGENPAAADAATGDAQVSQGSSSGASVLNPNRARTTQGWDLTPAGDQFDTLRFPLGIAAAPDGHMVVSTANGGLQGMNVLDPATGTSTPSPAANLFTGIAVTSDNTVWASGGNADKVFRWKLAGGVPVPMDATEAQPFPVHNGLNGFRDRTGLKTPLPSNGIDVPGYPGAMVLDGSLLYVAGTVSEAPPAGGCPSGQAACARVSIIDTATSTVVGRPAVGLDAFGMAVDSTRHRMYVTNWADEAGRGGNTGGTVSIVDITSPATAHEIGMIRVGHHPSAIQLSADGSSLFVANTNDDSLSVIHLDAAGDPTSTTTESVRPLSVASVGAHPDALALSPDGKLLFVALAGMNAVEARNGLTGAPLTNAPQYIPTGWYPSALTVTGTADDYKLWVTNMRGMGPGFGGNGSVFLQGTNSNGSVSAIHMPATAAELDAWTTQVHDNDRLDLLGTNGSGVADPCPSAGIEVSKVLCPAGGQSPIRHVVYIVTENKTFDQYFGDINATGGSGFDADPTYTLYGQTATPNHHKLATQFSLSDRFYSDAEVSVTGHSWTSGGIATDHNERTWQADYDEGIRGSHGGGDPLRPGIGGPAGGLAGAADNELQDPEGGYLFEAFKRAGAEAPSDNPTGLTMAIYGEHTAIESGDMDAYKAKGTQPGVTGKVDWKAGDLRYFDSCRAQQFINGSAPAGPNQALNGLPESPSIPVLGPATIRDCEGRVLDPQYTLAHWRSVQQTTGRDVMPSLIYMSLPVNHTMGANLGSPTPQSMVADNDAAIGMIVDAISHSPFWASTAIMITEDDTQVAADHVSSLRDYLQVISPYARNTPNHQWGSMPSLIRTIEQIFGVHPFTLNDTLALPQHGAFVADPAEADFTPYTFVRPKVPYALNASGVVGQAESTAMDFSAVDRIDEDTLNTILYAMARHTSLEAARTFLATH